MKVSDSNPLVMISPFGKGQGARRIAEVASRRLCCLVNAARATFRADKRRCRMAARPGSGALRVGAFGMFTLAALSLLRLAGDGEIVGVLAAIASIVGTFCLWWGFGAARRLTGSPLAMAIVFAYFVALM